MSNKFTKYFYIYIFVNYLIILITFSLDVFIFIFSRTILWNITKSRQWLWPIHIENPLTNHQNLKNLEWKLIKVRSSFLNKINKCFF